MGRNKSGLPSEKDILKQLAAERRETKERDLRERNEKIMRMVALGCDYNDISSRYGLKAGTIRTIITKKYPGQGVMSKFKGSNSHELARYCDGIS